MEKYSMEFGKKEHVLNYACQLYQLSRPAKVGAVMALIRECQPSSYEEWKEWYFENAYTATKTPVKLSVASLTELGERLYEKIQTFVIPDWQEAFSQLTLQDCIDYIYNLITFKESDPELDHAGDIDYVAEVGNYQFGIQIKPVTANANFGGYSLSERMKASFNDFTVQFGGKVFIVYSLKGEIANNEVIDSIREEINRLRSL